MHRFMHSLGGHGASAAAGFTEGGQDVPGRGNQRSEASPAGGDAKGPASEYESFDGPFQ